MIDLTDRQREILNFIIDFKADNEYSPTLREIGEACGFTVGRAFDHVMVLQKKGYILRIPEIARGIKIIKNPEVKNAV